MRRTKRLIEVIREFDDRGTQWLLESPENLRGFLLTAAGPIAHHLDCSKAEQIPTRFIPDNLRKQEADLLFRMPYRIGRGKSAQQVFVYVLIEHQSKPDPSMGFRLLFYMVQIWDRQRRQWLHDKVPVSEWRFLPIIPLVFYTGEQQWQMPLSLTTLMELPKGLQRFVPHFDVLALKLNETADEDLIASGHPLGWLLRMIKKQHASEEEFGRELEIAVGQLSGLAEEDRAALEKAAYYLYLLVHHRRGTKEGERLSKKMSQELRILFGGKRAQTMEQTLAESLIERGRVEGERKGRYTAKQETLLGLLAAKFGSLPEGLVQRVRTLQDTETLDRLVLQVLHAASLEEMGL